jgi:glycosidase/lipid-A-disaccharide synthase-like uncharacterized protein
MQEVAGWLKRICWRKHLALLMSGTLLHQQGFFIYEAWATRIVAPKVAPVRANLGSMGSLGTAGMSVSKSLGQPLAGVGLQPSVLPTGPALQLNAIEPLAANSPASRGADAFTAAEQPTAVAVGGIQPVTLHSEISGKSSVGTAQGDTAFTPNAERRGLAQRLSRLGKKILGGVGKPSVGFLKRFFDAGAKDSSNPATPGFASSGLGLLRGARLQAAPGVSEDAAAGQGQQSRLDVLKAVLGDGTSHSEFGRITPFVFSTQGEGATHSKARGAGLEGFLYRKLELEKRYGEGAFHHQLPHFFNYLEALLVPMDRGVGLRRELRTLRHLAMDDTHKNRELNTLLQTIVGDMRTEIEALDQALWGRSAHTYVLLARGYNRLREGRNFFDSIDDAELERIQTEIQADEIWLVDIYDIGEIRRWGTGGGSPYAIKGYSRIKEELGGLAAYKRLIARAHAKGLRVRTDLIPNHTSLDSELIEESPQAFFHLLPPQHLSDEEIMMGVPREDNEHRSPFFYLIKSQNYPGREGRETKVLIHHPRTDYGDVMWIDMAQIDYSVPEARAWMLSQVDFLFGEAGLDSVRRDMAYYVLNEGYGERWLTILQSEIELSTGWARQEMEKMRDDFAQRWAKLDNSEILAEISEVAKAANPAAVLHDEAYAYFDGLSRAGSDGVYGKNTHDAEMGQVGLYDAMRDRDSGAVREALRNMAFRFWQRGSATIVNFIGNHDEMNPVDRFGTVFRAASAVALLGGPILTYNGQELGTSQREMLGDLPGSVDKTKAIPFDVPVAINWSTTRPENAGFLKMIWNKRRQYAALYEQGAMDVLEPHGETPVVAYSVGNKESAQAVIVAANFSDQWAWGHFQMGTAVLDSFGGWSPAADKHYILHDQAHLGADGLPVRYNYSGQQLLEQGLFTHLAPGDAHIFEVEEVTEGAAATDEAAAQVQGRGLPLQRFRALNQAADLGPSQAASESKSSWWKADWGVWVERLVYFAIVPFLFLQLPQIMSNFSNLSADPEKISILPWIGYSTGIIANLTLLTYFTSIKKKAVALVQAVGVITSAVVLGQIFAAGYMPFAAMAVMPAIVVAGLTINLLKWMGKLPEKFLGLEMWKTWNDATVLLGLFALPLGVAVTFNLMGAYSWAVLGVSAALALGGVRLMLLDRQGKLPSALHAVWQTLGAWLATALFVFMPLPQIVNNVSNPENIAGIAVGTLILSVAGNILETTGAVYHKNRIWFTGSFWAIAVGGGAVLLSMYVFGALSPVIFWGFMSIVPLSLLLSLWLTSRHHGESMLSALSFLWKTPKGE